MPLLRFNAPDFASATVNGIDLSVIVLNWNAGVYLPDALRSLHRDWQAAVEVIVVDNASQFDDSADVAARDFPWARLVRLPVNVGFAGGNNAGIRVARGRYLLFLNPDTITHEGALDALVAWMDAHPRAGACGPKLLNSDGSLQTSCRGFPSFGTGLFRSTPLGRLFPNNPWTRSYLMEDFRHDAPSRVDWLSGAALLVRREALDQIGVWDEGFFMYCEDVDLCYRLKTANWERWYVPQSVITHRIGGSSDWAQGAMIRQHHGSMLRFYAKHYARGSGVFLMPLAVAGIGVRALGAVFQLYRRYFRIGVFGRMVRDQLQSWKRAGR